MTNYCYAPYGSLTVPYDLEAIILFGNEAQRNRYLLIHNTPAAGFPAELLSFQILSLGYTHSQVLRGRHTYATELSQRLEDRPHVSSHCRDSSDTLLKIIFHYNYYTAF